MITDFKIFENNNDVIKYENIKKELISYMVNFYELEKRIIIGIIDYENDKEQLYNTLKNILFYEPDISIKTLSDKIMKNDEGSYQIDIIESEPEKHPIYMKNKIKKDFNI